MEKARHEAIVGGNSFNIDPEYAVSERLVESSHEEEGQDPNRMDDGIVFDI